MLPVLTAMLVLTVLPVLTTMLVLTVLSGQKVKWKIGDIYPNPFYDLL